MVNERKKRRWFELGAESFARVRPGLYDDLIYPCPICLGRFTIEALAQNQLSAEHVPPESLGGRELLLTCRNCNNSSGQNPMRTPRLKRMFSSPWPEHLSTHIESGRCSAIS